ncbi:hypothetical protein RB608_17270 [Nocardioides sp. LHD-245]|uniref:hypothetical protein n=1 Tax=Nocardioides sp. LHD-245 TaxID=3051387 RepID=UPI0027DF1C3A|nr:hypothetical protein [Nocardioides sp. LHD-245]
MPVFLAWSAAAVPEDVRGPWTELRRLTDELSLVESTESLSRVYHELKWALPEGTALLVAPLSERPKLKGLPATTTTWLRDRIAGPHR